jgi:hypothetical protein
MASGAGNEWQIRLDAAAEVRCPRSDQQRVQPRAGSLQYGALYGIAHKEHQALRNCTPHSRSWSDLPRKCWLLQKRRWRTERI